MNRYKNINFQIAFTGIILSLVLLFQYLEKFMLFADTFVKINISLIFIMATAYLAGFWWSFLLLVLRFLLGPALSAVGYSFPEIWAQFVLFSFGLMFLGCFFACDIFLKSKFEFKNSHTRVLLALTFSIFVVAILGSLVNAVLFTPGYWWTYSFIPHFSLNESIQLYNQDQSHVIQIRFFGIPNYWAGTLTVYFISNIIKYTIVAIGFLLIWRVLKIFVIQKNQKCLNNI